MREVDLELKNSPREHNFGNTGFEFYTNTCYCLQTFFVGLKVKDSSIGLF